MVIMSRDPRVLSISLAVLVCLSGTVALGDDSPSHAAPAVIQVMADQAQRDEEVASRVEERLRTDGRIDWEALGVEVKEGEVTLYGEVETKDQKGIASLIASTVPGVTGLTNSVIVDKAHSKDYRLQKAVWSTLRGVDALREQTSTLRVRVKNAVATLSGSVDQQVQKLSAEKAAGSVPEVATVVNKIQIRQAPLQTEREKLRKEGLEQVP
jgi:osmotically-inducible protein OsmY